jgi:hypothetical protein
MDVVLPSDTNGAVAQHRQHKEFESVEQLRLEATKSYAAAQGIYEEEKKLPARYVAPSRAAYAALLSNERKKLEFLCNFWFELKELGIVRVLADVPR